jgi:flagellar motor switch protein FliN/FliY
MLDIKINLHVELGRTSMNIKEILELGRGTVLELDRLAGEPVDLFANGKLIARGEVVVIEDNFGLRVTNIVSPQERLKV